MSWMPTYDHGEWLVVENGGEQVKACLCREDAEDIAEQLNTHEAEQRFRPNWPAIGVYGGLAVFWIGVGLAWRLA